MNRNTLSTLLLLAALTITSAAVAQNKPAQNKKAPAPQNPNSAVVSDENATERRSGIADTVDIVNGPTVQNITRNSAVLVWSTNKTAATRVVYGASQGQLNQHAYVPGGAKDHRVELRNLKPNTTYFYAIDNRGGKQRYDGSFQTPNM